MDHTDKLLTMIEETAKKYDKTLHKLASGEPDEGRPENKENTDKANTGGEE